jgi:hypothetical protein
MAPQSTCAPVKAVLSPSGILDHRNSFPLLRGNFGDGNGGAGTPRSNEPLRQVARKQSIDPAATPPFVPILLHSNTASPLPVWVHSKGAKHSCDNLTLVKSNTPLAGKTMTRLANKPFGQGYFCMSLSGSSSAGNYPPGPSPGPSCRARRVRRRP